MQRQHIRSGALMLINAAIVVAALMTVALAHAGEHESEDPDASTGLVRDVREATQNFNDVTAAIAAGYVSVASCESGPNEGAMGVHYVNAAFVDDGVLDVHRPEVLHVWAWKGNPKGAFSDWNPQVSCVEYTGETERRGSAH
jgi:hypothetical protein